MIAVTIKHEYLEMIRDGRKSLEIRVGYPNILSVIAGSQVLLISGDDRQTVMAREIRKYDTFHQMLAQEDYKKIIPGASKMEVLRVLQQIYPPEKESLGVVVIEVGAVESTEMNT